MQTTSMRRAVRPGGLQLGGAVTVAVATLLLAGSGTADAGQREKRDVELVRPASAPDADASGVLRITTTKRGDKGLLRLRDLDPRTRYEVHDAATDEVLGVVRTNRRGKARMKLSRRVVVAGKRALFEVPEEIEVCRLGDDEPLLRADTDPPVFLEPGDMPVFGFEAYAGAEGWHAFVDMFSFTSEDMEGFHLSLSGEPTERGQQGELYEYGRDTFAGDELPLGVDSVADLSGRAFRVVDPAGTVYVRGVLPDLQRPRMPPIFEPPVDPPQRPNPDDPTGGDPSRGAPNRDGTTDSRGAGGTGGFMPGIPGPDGGFDGPPRGGDVGFDDLIRIMPPDFMPFPMPEREASRLRLEVADDDGVLTDVGNLDRIVFPDFEWPRWDDVGLPLPGCPMDGDTGSGEGDPGTAPDRPAR